MIDEYLIRPLYKYEWDEAMKLSWSTFILFEAPDYSKEGIKSFKTFVKDPVLKTLFLEGRYKTMAAFHNGLMIGFLGVRNETHISLLFVDSEYHKRGIATKLLYRMFDDIKKCGKSEMTVNSSPYAVGFYHKIGFTDTGGELLSEGIRYTPMIIRLQDLHGKNI